MNAVRVLANAAPKVVAPATRRATSSGPTFKSLWMPGETMPIIAVIAGGGVLVGVILSRNSLAHPDTIWTKNIRQKGVCVWYEKKYPGTTKEANSGARSAHAH